ncbi:phage antirepressor KilAC domain-containing protein [Bifidobacterium thermacidophilum]|uniref:Phage antirepressor protein, BRO family n=1 Tax=Bifidobacterium thermacidophilum subsp. thermacidophilum TaxID=79262 RepID=A0A087E4G2_9BIFI|nr:phage antirepressor [Bifidobacterium thermacidophilum]KFJ02663.1 phage antirepressor protein, BRO family [Bifidobacterium thermacidophilum subsp. thermacidophilum]
MSKQIETYRFHGSDPVRVVTGEDGEPWFVAKDVCDILGIGNNRDAIAALDDDEKNTVAISDGIPGNPNKTIVSEPGLYKLVMRSRKPEAKEFQRWVTHEVLPSIRKHGGYMAGQEQMTPEQMLAASMRWLQSRIREQEETISRQAGQLEEQRPKVLFADAVSASDGTCLIGELAKMLTQAGYVIGQNRLFVRLREDGYLGKTGQNRNVPLQRWVEQGLFRIKETAVTHADGHVTINRTTKVTGRGQTYFLRKYAGIKGDIKQQTKGF